MGGGSQESHECTHRGSGSRSPRSRAVVRSALDLQVEVAVFAGFDVRAVALIDERFRGLPRLEFRVDVFSGFSINLCLIFFLRF